MQQKHSAKSWLSSEPSCEKQALRQAHPDGILEAGALHTSEFQRRAGHAGFCGTHACGVCATSASVCTRSACEGSDSRRLPSASIRMLLELRGGAGQGGEGRLCCHVMPAH